MITSIPHFRRYLAPLSGAVVFLSIQMALFWRSRPVPGVEHSGWFLNSGHGIVAVAVTFVAVGALLGLSRRDGVGQALVLALGATLAMVLTLFTMGAGTIFPIVIVFGGVLTVGATVVGAALGAAARSALGMGQRVVEKFDG